VDQEKIRISIDWDRGAQSSGAPCAVEPPESRKREILEVRVGCGKEMAGAMQFVPDPAHDAPADAVHADIVRIFLILMCLQCCKLECRRQSGELLRFTTAHELSPRIYDRETQYWCCCCDFHYDFDKNTTMCR
jgi:hypothetical protein